MTASASELMADGISTTDVRAEVSDWLGNPMSWRDRAIHRGRTIRGCGRRWGVYLGSRQLQGLELQWPLGHARHHRVVRAVRHDGAVTVLYRAGIEPGEVRIRATVTGGLGGGTAHAGHGA